MAGPVDPRATLAAYLRVERATDRKVAALLRQALRDVDRQIRTYVGDAPGVAVRREQARLARAAILRRTATLIRDAGDVVQAARVEAAAAADDEFAAYDRVLMRGIPAGTREAYLAAAKVQAKGAVEAAERRLLGAGYVPLSQQVYRTGTVAAGLVDSAVNSALARNLTAREFAKEVSRLVDPLTPGGVSYAAMRLARTEVNNSFHARARQRIIDSPWDEGALWNLSGSHPRPDQCNDYAESQHYEGGDPGVYLPDDVPGKPHPACRCFVTPVTVPEDTFLDRFFAGDYDDVIDRHLAA